MTAPIAPINLAGGTVITVQLLRYDGSPFSLDGQPVEFTCTGDDLAERLAAYIDSGWVQQRRDAVNQSQHAELIANGTQFGVSIYQPLDDVAETASMDRAHMIERLADNVAKAARS